MATLKADMWLTSSCWAEAAGRAVQGLVDQRRPGLSGKAPPTRNQSSNERDQSAEREPRPMAAGKQRQRGRFGGEKGYTKKRNKEKQAE